MFTSWETLTEGLRHNGPACGESQVNSQGIFPTQHRLQWPFLLLCVLLSQSCPTLCNPMECSLLGLSIHGILWQEYWRGLPCPSGNLPDPGIEPRSPALQTDSLPSELPGKPQMKGLSISKVLYVDPSFWPVPSLWRNHLNVSCKAVPIGNKFSQCLFVWASLYFLFITFSVDF